MSGTVDRRKRILRIRGIEHRAATARVAEAGGVLANLHDVAGRIEALRSQLVCGFGPTNSNGLKAMCEMAQRLDAARGGLIQPMGAAKAALTHVQQLRIQANQKEESAAKLEQRATTSELKARELRADANRPFRRSRNSGDML